MPVFFISDIQPGLGDLIQGNAGHPFPFLQANFIILQPLEDAPVHLAAFPGGAGGDPHQPARVAPVIIRLLQGPGRSRRRDFQGKGSRDQIVDVQKLAHHPAEAAQDRQGDPAGLVQKQAQCAPAPARPAVLQFHQFHSLGR